MQNPFNRFCETAIKWLGIHTRDGHKLDDLTFDQKRILQKVKIEYKATHYENGRRKARLNAKQYSFFKVIKRKPYKVVRTR